MENYPKALKYFFNNAYSINASLYGKEDATTASNSLAICDVYSAMGEHSKAQDCNVLAYVILINYWKLRMWKLRSKEPK